MLVSVIIPTYNKVSRLKLTICSLLRQENFNFEIVIVDDGSDYQTKKFLSELQSSTKKVKIKVITQTNQGRSIARNIGVKNSEGDRLVFIDDDIIVDSDFIEQHAKDNSIILHGKIITLSYLKFFQNPSTGEFYKGFSEKISNSNSVLLSKCISETEIERNFEGKISCNDKISNTEWLIQLIFESNIEVLKWIGVTGGNFSISRKWFDEVGGFDSRFGKQWGYEDFELGYRLISRKLNIAYSNSAVGYHIAHYRENESIVNENAKIFVERYNTDEKIKIIIDFLGGYITRKEVEKLL